MYLALDRKFIKTPKYVSWGLFFRGYFTALSLDLDTSFNREELGTVCVDTYPMMNLRPGNLAERNRLVE